ncbi:hypothetical protein EHF33_14640 [Deinococcus psychrotolerans]|uniref:PKD domain-containing protein n=1 Tax=Deinococcus psychrotolerans TaxID=2489213 RepID=A0A3G8YH26_9DEIO|nr:hypothetical protein [Deinococcus psychrotolerans]AZI44140.1 hypothetical protein EHF33_14640 [Deinococcus psychrotolerans]
MKKYVAFAFLTLSLAACGQQAVQPAAQLSAIPIGQGGQTYSTTSEALEAQVMADLNRRGFGDTLSAQGLAPQVYLNVLPVPTSDDSVRAYVKSSFTSPVTCSVTWGDGSTSTSVASPTVGRIETKDHAYATFGTYTITTTCVNGATVVGTQSVTVQAGKKATGVIIDFENPVAPLPAPGYLLFASYQEKGFTFTTQQPDSSSLVVFAPNGPFSYYNINTQGLSSNYGPPDAIIIKAANNAPFSLMKFDYRKLQFLRGGTFGVTVTGYKSNNTIVTLHSTTSTDNNTTVTLDSNWTDLTRVELLSDSAYLIIDNVNVSK